MTSETGVDFDRYSFSFMTIIAAFRIWLVEDIPDQSWPITAMRIVAGTTIYRIFREFGMYLFYLSTGMAIQTQRFWRLDEKIGIC